MNEEEIKQDVDLGGDEGDNEIYELGYHILPTVSEEDVPSEVSKIHGIISEHGGSIISEGNPSMKGLSYEIVKKSENKNLKFSKAYFGWIKLEVDRSKILDLKNKVENFPSVLRLLVIKTVRENTINVPKMAFFKKEGDVVKDNSVVVDAPKVPASEEEIDKSIENLVTEETA